MILFYLLVGTFIGVLVYVSFRKREPSIFKPFIEPETPREVYYSVQLGGEDVCEQSTSVTVSSYSTQFEEGISISSVEDLSVYSFVMIDGVVFKLEGTTVGKQIKICNQV